MSPIARCRVGSPGRSPYFTIIEASRLPHFLFKTCKKCRGDLALDDGDWICLQCGSYYYVGLYRVPDAPPRRDLLPRDDAPQTKGSPPVGRRPSGVPFPGGRFLTSNKGRFLRQ